MGEPVYPEYEINELRTRVQVLKQFETADNGRITSPGKFEGEALYVPYFWEKGLSGWYDDEEDGNYVFFVMPEDREQFPELKQLRRVVLTEDDNGFVRELIGWTPGTKD